VADRRLDSLQLLLLGTTVEFTYLVLQIPTGALADAFSRRFCVVTGLIILGAGFVLQGLSSSFQQLVFAQVVVGLGAASKMELKARGSPTSYRTTT
jgi:DHA3 family tetracycline resistance protein-like MFS transporter